jgi:hypothetical protein
MSLPLSGAKQQPNVHPTQVMQRIAVPMIAAIHGLIKGWRLPLVRRPHGDFITLMIIELAANGYGRKSAREAPG